MLWHNMISKSMINKDIKNLTGVSHKDLTFLGQCWESSSHFLVPLPLLIHKMFLESYEEDIHKFHRGPLTIIILMVIFAGIALKEFQSIFTLAICCNRRHSLRPSSPIWASEASRGRTRERAAKRVPLARLLFTISPEWRTCSQATAFMKQFQCRNIVLNNKTGPSFLEFNWCK